MVGTIQEAAEAYLVAMVVLVVAALQAAPLVGQEIKAHTPQLKDMLAVTRIVTLQVRAAAERVRLAEMFLVIHQVRAARA